MTEAPVRSIEIQELPLWDKIRDKRRPLSFDLEITARCNNNCRHCYINLPAGDRAAREAELSLEEIEEIADEAVSLGALWCLVTGGEPLLRKDFAELYPALKKKGLLVSVFTNATVVTRQHARLFEKYPPRDIEVSVYGATEATYERVTRRPGSYAEFRRGLDLLLGSGVKVRFKAMALRSNVDELPEMARFCRDRTKDYFRFDPQLHLRFDGDPARNREIESERLSPEEIVMLERSDPERFEAMRNGCDSLIMPERPTYEKCTACAEQDTCEEFDGFTRLLHCGAGNGSFNVSYDGLFRLCSSLWHPDCVYDLRKGNLTDAWNNLFPRVRGMRSDRKEFLQTCRSCEISNLCLWCPAHAHLETGELDAPVEYFCKVAHARAEMLKESATGNRESCAGA
ncbi:MAG: radical SAM protein [Planctomycetes bacterium]|nr:radical SAM protein [Planctomycetota bacterium]